MGVQIPPRAREAGFRTSRQWGDKLRQRGDLHKRSVTTWSSRTVLVCRSSWTQVRGGAVAEASEVLAAFGARVAELRRARGMSQADLASASGVDRVSISRVERGL
ncbi:XRE family transcriptional regulator [Flexivirga caeni]|uniref:XRE family transcriptional regulator n=1 Tax=Flexivirga caeni TaxID=2294115 RepID=A0A3M9M286_9MICO|nr:XRE family transcriptional regulator [Flexivirga caeni]